MAPKTQNEDKVIFTQTVEQGSVSLVAVGMTPLVHNRLSEKAKHELLLPKGRKSEADRAAILKHNPIEEFRASAHLMPATIKATLLGFPAAAIKRALASAALDMPGNAKKAQVGRLVWVPGERLSVYGIPKLFMATVRQAGIQKTPDIRTRLIMPEWVLPFTVDFVTPIINPTIIINLASAAGLYIGLGDGRNEKGALTFGQFRIMSKEQASKDPKVAAIMRQGKKEQEALFEAPEAYDSETEELLGWFNTEIKVRGKHKQAAAGGA